MSILLAGAYETHTNARVVCWRQRYHHRADLNLLDRAVVGPAPTEMESFQVNVEGCGWLDLTWIVANTDPMGPPLIVRDPKVRIYDIDGVTVLDEFLQNFVFTLVLAGASTGFQQTVLPAPGPLITNEQGRVWRVVTLVWEFPAVVQASINAFAKVRHGRLLP